MNKKIIPVGKRSLLFSAFFSFLIVLFSCREEKKENKKTEQTQQSEKDYFTDKINLKYVKGFDVKYYGNYKVLRIINPYKNSKDTLTYVLVQRGTPKPTIYKSAQVIEIPIQKFACVYTTHVAFTDLLESVDIIKGFASPEYIINPKVRQGLKDGSITYLGQPDDLNQETVIALHPEVLMVAGVTITDISKYKTIIESGISVLVNAEWRENTPLGRAEWFKMLALFLNKERLANSKFDHVEKEYLKLQALTKQIKKKPEILTGLNFKGTWFIPGGKSYMSYFINDAGATYPWVRDSTTASFPLNFESVYEKGLTTDLWLNPEFADSKAEILKVDPRCGDFRAFKTGNIYNNNRRIADNGGNDYWETGILNPHIILADLIKICHPALLPEHELYYYKQLK